MTYQGTPTSLVPKWEREFKTFEQWVNKASTWIDKDAVCIDAKGRRCLIGADFMRARDEDAFPVRFFWECEEHPALAGVVAVAAPAPVAAVSMEVINVLLKAARTLPSLKGITLSSQDPMAQARWLTALGDLKKAVDEYDDTAVRAFSDAAKTVEKVIAVLPENDTPVRCPGCNWCGWADELGPEGECGSGGECAGRPVEITDHADLIRAWQESEGTIAGSQCRDAGLIEPHPATEQEARDLDIDIGDAVWDLSEKGQSVLRARGEG